MTYAKRRAYISTKEEELIRHYSLSPLYREKKRGDLAKLIIDTIQWPGKVPEVEVLEKKITGYRNDGPALEDGPWSLGESAKPEYGIPADATGILL